MASSLSSFSSSFSYGWTYDVFLSFRGKDTRHGFTGNLFNALKKRGNHTFFDDQELQGGEEITPTLVKAIEESRIAIPVFSENYASSSFCLDELVKIIECVKAKGRLVLPVFYGVDPCDVRHQSGSYAEAMAKQEERFKDNKKKVKKWRKALKQAANLSGKHFIFGKNEYEHEFIKKIVEVVSIKINRVPLYVADYLVGLEYPMLGVCSCLGVELESDDGVHMVGIHGIGGIGKTTLARVVYNLIADQFEGLCFLENIRENSIKFGLEHLQETLLSEIVGEKDIKLGSVNKGIQIIKHRLHRKKVLLVLDDVDKRQHLQTLVGRHDWFGSGSRVIITTRDKHLLASHGVERTYELNGLREEDARKLFEWNAFKNKEVDPSFIQVINRVVTYAAHLPLALEVIGSNLCGKQIEEWESTLDRYERIPEKDIQIILKISFDGLDEDAQSVFLDIACCFKEFNLMEVKDILCAHHGVCLIHAIGVLVDRSLIKINQNGKVTLHDLIQDMGREIVRQEGKPGKRSRLWFPEDIVQVFEDNEGTCKIEMIFLDLHKSKEQVVEWDGEAFKDMKSLRTLIIRNTYFSQGPKHLPNSLRVLEWWRYPLHSLPADFHPKKLVIFKLPYSCLTSLDLLKLQKEFVNMRVLILDFANCVTNIPDLSCVPNLEELSFVNCENLIKIDESVGFLGKLKMLNAYGCSKLRSFPPLMLTSLDELTLSYCSNLESFPEILGKMENITGLYLQYTAINKLPLSVQNLTRLQKLYMNECGLLEFPSSITLLPELSDLLICRSPKQNEGEEEVSSIESLGNKWLRVSHCNIPDEIFPIVFAWFALNVQELDLKNFNCIVLPTCITECLLLRKLNVEGCRNLRQIRGLPPNLETFSATYCRSLEDLDLTVLAAGTKEYRFLSILILDHCENLREIRGIPPNIEILSASNCTSLTSSCRSVLLSQELYEEGGNMCLFMPGSRIPEWFQHRSRGSSISFWFRNMFSAISLCVVFVVLDDDRIPFFFRPILGINGYKVDKWPLTNKGAWVAPGLEADHIFILDKEQMKLEDNVNEVLLENNEWNHAKVFINTYNAWETTVTDMQIGICVFQEKSSIEDIRFTDPYERVKRDHNNVNWVSNSVISTQTSSTSNVKGLQEQQHLTSIDQHKLEDCESVNKAKGREWWRQYATAMPGRTTARIR